MKEMRRAGVRVFAEAEVYEADRKRRALEERGARGDRLHARHPLPSDADDAAILAQVLLRMATLALFILGVVVHNLLSCIFWSAYANATDGWPVMRTVLEICESALCMYVQASEQVGSGGSRKACYTTGSSGLSVASQLAAWRARRGVALDITALPGMDALSAKVLPLSIFQSTIFDPYLSGNG